MMLTRTKVRAKHKQGSSAESFTGANRSALDSSANQEDGEVLDHEMSVISGAASIGEDDLQVRRQHLNPLTRNPSKKTMAPS